jgi:hypothetical protein
VPKCCRSSLHFVPEKALYNLYCCILYGFETPIEVRYFLVKRVHTLVSLSTLC